MLEHEAVNILDFRRFWKLFKKCRSEGGKNKDEINSNLHLFYDNTLNI